MPGSGALDASTPAEAQTKPCRVSAITEPLAHAHDADGLAQDGLHLARVALVAGGSAREGRRLELVEPHDAALGLGHDLLGHDDDVAVGRLDRAGEQRAEVVARAAPRGSPSTGITRSSLTRRR